MGSSKIYNKGRLFASSAIQRFASNFKKKLVFTLLEIYFHISDAGFYQCVWCICIFQTIFRMGLMKRNMVSCITSQKNFEKLISLVQCFSYTKNYFSIHLITYQPSSIHFFRCFVCFCIAFVHCHHLFLDLHFSPSLSLSLSQTMLY